MLTMSRTNLFLLLAAAITIGSGLLHGHLNQRWGIDQQLQAAAEKLQRLPDSFGDWKLKTTKPLSDSAVDMLQCAGYLNAIYVNDKTGEQITAAIMVGPGSTMAIHTPEICYSAKNFKQLGGKRVVEVEFDNRPDQSFWAVDFEVNDVAAKELRVHYAWSDGSDWRAPDKPRLAFAGKRTLFKLQVAEYLSPLQVNADDTTVRFLRDFLPLLDEKESSGANIDHGI